MKTPFIETKPVIALVAILASLVGGVTGTAADDDASHLTLHENLVQAWTAENVVDLGNLRAVFWHVFSQLPSEVKVFPSENYYYWQLDIDGRHIQGNIRFSPRDRDRQCISFAYSEPRVRNNNGTSKNARIAERAILGPEEGVTLTQPRPGICELGYGDHFVRFHLENLSQQQPPASQLRDGEEFVGRTCDESGLRFLLLFQSEFPRLFWVLDESQPKRVADHFVELAPEIVIGRRTGFVFRSDSRAGNRKVLIAVRRSSVRANSYYDGPFDQLPDNHVSVSRISERLILENPALKGKIDAYGYYIKDDPPLRVALVRYASYKDRDHLSQLIGSAERSGDWLSFFSSRPDE